MLYVYDVDMTLAESDCQMTPDFKEVFLKAMEGNKFFFCSGSQLTKMCQQMTDSVMEKAEGWFPCMGGEFYKQGEEVYKRSFVWPQGLNEDLEEILANSKYPERTGDHIQDRGAMVCFSTVGKAANHDQRLAYYAWEDMHQERKDFAADLRLKYPGYLFIIGGKTSIDISMEGNDKGQLLKVLREHYGDEPITFVGDRMFEGGNDWPLAEKLRIEKEERGIPNRLFPVKTPTDTMKILREWIEREEVA